MASKIFTDKIVLITGASTGNGAAIAKYMAKLGASLVITGRKMENLQQVVKSCQIMEPTSKPLIIKSDLTNEEHTKNLVDSTIEHFGRLDVLVNTAGIIELGSIEDTSLEQLNRVIATNVRSFYNLTHLTLPHLISTKGNIVNVRTCSSQNGSTLLPTPKVLAYNIALAALDDFTKSMAIELASKQVRVNNVNSEVTFEELEFRKNIDKINYAKYLERVKENYALGYPGQSEEVAKAVVFLAEQNKKFITGANIPVNGAQRYI